jgi:hypothetical protein
LEALVEGLFAIVAEIVGEVLVAVVWTSLGGWIASLCAGAAVGGLSLLALPNALIEDPALRLTGLVVTPLFAGLASVALGALRSAPDQDPIRLDAFLSGALFAFALCGVRFAFAV